MNFACSPTWRHCVKTPPLRVHRERARSYPNQSPGRSRAGTRSLPQPKSRGHRRKTYIECYRNPAAARNPASVTNRHNALESGFVGVPPTVNFWLIRA